jgi:hypothetical protein
MDRRKRWTLDALESRDLPSASPTLALLHAKVKTMAVAVAAPAEGGSGVTADPSPPRPREVARRAFVGKFAGKVVELPPRLADEARQFYFQAPGTTNQFLHGTLQMRLFTPKAPATQTSGVAAISDRNNADGAVLLLDMTGNPADVDAKGRPTHFDFTVNGGGGSGGIYASSVGSGTLDLAYRGNKATVAIRGSVYTSGIGNPLVVYVTSKV